MAACCYPPAARFNRGKRTLPRRDELGGRRRLAHRPRAGLTDPLPNAEAPGPKQGSKLIVPLLGFSLVLVIALVVNIILLGLASTRPVSTYPIEGPREPALSGDPGGTKSGASWTAPSRKCCQLPP